MESRKEYANGLIDSGEMSNTALKSYGKSWTRTGETRGLEPSLVALPLYWFFLIRLLHHHSSAGAAGTAHSRLVSEYFCQYY